MKYDLQATVHWPRERKRTMTVPPTPSSQSWSSKIPLLMPSEVIERSGSTRMDATPSYQHHDKLCISVITVGDWSEMLHSEQERAWPTAA